MRYAVLGAAGQLGRDLCPRLPGEVVALARDRADLTKPDALRATLDEVAPEVVVNCAAYNLVDRAESEPPAAFAVNAWGVRELALWCRKRGRLLVHFSSDYVFGLDESRRTPWAESDAPGPVSVYGLSKLAGEYLVRSTCPDHLVIRTCGLYGVWGSGGKGGNFVETMLRLAREGRPLRVVADQVCAPSYTADVADAAVALLTAGKQGLFHVTNAGSCSWHEFARAIFELTGVSANLTSITSAEYGAAARRPAYSVLTSEGLSPLRPWREALAAYLGEREKKRGA
ncbi:MAG TPA: dTDP-4-dehydrorhamnose reductase [Gemmataceae bacterium]|nr:dTDP-4-dehydrorhamnose reductase [Gemmataceae bacterium]